MTSSFELPGGYYRLYRAEVVASGRRRRARSQGLSRKAIASQAIATQWVLLDDPNPTGEVIAPDPPDRQPDYVGQIVAVATRPSGSLA